MTAVILRLNFQKKMFINHYDILGVDANADLVQITAAWKRLLKKYHPDLNQNDQDATEQTILINKAYEILSNPQKRKRFDDELRNQQLESEPQVEVDEPEVANEFNQSNRPFQAAPQNSFSKSSKAKTKKNSYAAVMMIVGILLGALTAIPIGLFLVWAISGFDPMGIFRQPAEAVAKETEETNTGTAATNSTQPPDADAKQPAEAKQPDEITISYAKFGESRQTTRVEKFVEEVANKENIITPITTPGLQTTNPVGRPREYLRVTYQVNGRKTGTLSFKYGEEVNLRQAILKHAKSNARPFETIEITYALFGKQRNKVRCEEQLAAVASQIDVITPITTHGLSLRNPSGIVRHQLVFNYKVGGKTGEMVFNYGQNLDVRKTILEHANVLDGSYTPSLTKSESSPPKTEPNENEKKSQTQPPVNKVAESTQNPNSSEPKSKSPTTAPTATPALPKTYPIPAEADVTTAKSKIAEIFKNDYNLAKRAVGKEELDKLSAVAGDVYKLTERENDPATLYALFEIAINIARESCSKTQPFEYVQQFEIRFPIDGLTKRLELLKEFRKDLPRSVKDEEELRRTNVRLSGLAHVLLRQAVEEERWQAAIDIAEVFRGFCVALGEKAKANSLKQATNSLKRRLVAASNSTKFVAETNLSSMEPEKATAVGSYICFTQQDWNKGLKYLAKCNSPALAEAAKADLSANKSSYVSAADHWWDLALDDDNYDYRLAMLSRAKHFYGLAVVEAAGIDKSKLEKRINDANKTIWGDGFFFDRLNDFKSPSSGIKLILVQNGSFEMGEHQKNIDAFGKNAKLYGHEGPRHPVTISKNYYLGQHEVTQDQWIKIMGTQPWRVNTNVTREGQFPAVHISWNEANEFCKRLSALDKKKYRLPTEAEWEYACRAGTTTRYFSGDPDTSVFPFDWVRDNCYYTLGYRCGQMVGTRLANPFGFYDMHGNVYEWCQDSYEADFYTRAPNVDPVNTADIDQKAFRSGSVYGRSWTGRSASRHFGGKEHRDGLLGFRILLENQK